MSIVSMKEKMAAPIRILILLLVVLIATGKSILGKLKFLGNIFQQKVGFYII
jgi:hypothetical protein